MIKEIWRSNLSLVEPSGARIDLCSGELVSSFFYKTTLSELFGVVLTKSTKYGDDYYTALWSA